MSPRKNVQALEDAIIQLARQEADALLDVANAQAASIYQSAQAKTEAESARILETAQQEIAKHIEHAAARAQLEAQMHRLKRREQTLAHVFDVVREHLTAIPQQADYTDIVDNLLREAATQLSGHDFVVHADARTRDMLAQTGLDTLARDLDATLELGTLLESGTGVVLATPDGRRRYDNTFEARLARMQDDLRSPVYHILMENSQ